jgi:hypothetical protein
VGGGATVGTDLPVLGAVIGNSIHYRIYVLICSSHLLSTNSVSWNRSENPRKDFALVLSQCLSWPRPLAQTPGVVWKLRGTHIQIFTSQNVYVSDFVVLRLLVVRRRGSTSGRFSQNHIRLPSSFVKSGNINQYLVLITLCRCWRV